MSLQDKIQAKREQLTVKRDALATLTETDVSGDESIEESVTHEITELSDVIKTLEGEIDSLETARAALAAKALDREPATKSTQDPTTPRFSGGVAKREKHFNAIAAVSCLLKAPCTQILLGASYLLSMSSIILDEVPSCRFQKLR